MGEVIAIVSGKGGPGKTSLCAGVAMALAQQGKQVLCIDCDVRKGDLDISLGIQEQMALSFLDICRGDYPLDQSLQHPGYPNLRYLSAPIQYSAQDLEEPAFAAILRRAKEKMDYVLLDGGTLGSPGFSLAAQNADRCVLVTGFDVAATRAAERAGQALELLGQQNVRMVVSPVQPKTMAAMGITVDDVMDRAGLPLLGIVPADAQVPLAAASGKPLLHFSKKAAAAYIRIAKRIQGIPVPVPTR